ncbi:MAG: hypothetical protein ACYCZF_17000 [Anaerolineae bacterium]
MVHNLHDGIPPAIIPDTTKPLTEETTQHLVSVSEDGSVYTFDQVTPELQTLQVGHIMVGSANTTTPYGFLRKVTSIAIENGQVRISTEQASLVDAIQQGGFSVNRRLTPADVQGGYLAPGVSLSPSVQGLSNAFRLKVEDVVLYDEDGNRSTTDDQVKANGSLELAPSFEFDLAIRDWTLEHLTTVIHADELAELEITAEAELVGLKARRKIAELPLGTITVLIGWSR